MNPAVNAGGDAVRACTRQGVREAGDASQRTRPHMAAANDRFREHLCLIGIIARHRSGGSRRSRPPGRQINNIAARLFNGDTPPGKRCRLGPLNSYSKIIKLGNQARHFLDTLKQSLNATTATHKRHSHEIARSSAHCEHMRSGSEFSNAGRILFDKRRMQQANVRAGCIAFKTRTVTVPGLAS